MSSSLLSVVIQTFPLATHLALGTEDEQIERVEGRTRVATTLCESVLQEEDMLMPLWWGLVAEGRAASPLLPSSSNPNQTRKSQDLGLTPRITTSLTTTSASLSLFAMFKKRTRPANVRSKEDSPLISSSTNAEASSSTDPSLPAELDEDDGPSVG